MKIRILILLFCSSVYGVKAQAIKDVLQNNDITPKEHISGDIEVTDTLQSEDFYQLLFVSGQDTTSLFEAKVIPRGQDTLVLGIKGYESDMQCTFHPSAFYTIIPQGKTLFSIESAFNIHPSYFINEAKIMAIFKKHLTAIRDVYLGDDGTVEQVFNEIYTPEYHFRKNSDIFHLTLTVCDYIYVNHGIFTEKEWSEISSVQEIHISFPE